MSAQSRSQIKALLWEEARIGGSIALICSIVGTLILAQALQTYGAYAWVRDEFLVWFAAVAIPLLTALLLILNPNYSGHLAGGFSKRVLRLPVETSVAVAVTLSARTVFMLATSGVLLGSCGYVFEGAPGYAGVSLMVLFYLAAQLVDWMRGAIRGLSSFVLLSVLVFGLFSIWPGRPEPSPLTWALDVAAESPAAMPVIVVFAFAFTYFLSLPLVNMGRVGRTYGVPEIWQWSRDVDRGTRTRKSPFRSPFTAQVWFELRRTRWLLPIVSALALVLFVCVHWMVVMSGRTESDFDDSLRVGALVGVFAAVLVGAAVQGIQSRVIGFRRVSRLPGYEYLQPLTDAQFATARIIVGTILLVPTLLVALVIHFSIGTPYVVFELIPSVVRQGFGSPREIIWIFLGRGLLAGLAAWSLLAIGTRAFRWLIAVGVCVAIAAYLSDSFLQTGFLSIRQGQVPQAALPFVIAAIASAVVMIVLAWRAGLISRRFLFVLAGIWMLFAWLVRYAAVSSFVPNSASLGDHLLAIIVAIGYCAPIPLVYVAILFDVRRRRRTSTRPQVRDPNVLRFASGGVASRIAVPVVVLIVLWLGWPGKGAYVEYFRNRGYPTTLKELDDSYAEPPAGQNAATKYLEVADREEELLREFDTFISIAAKTAGGLGAEPAQLKFNSWDTSFWDFPYIVGGGEWTRVRPLDKRSWQATEIYWDRVSSKLVPSLQEIGGTDTDLARYPLNAEEGFNTDMQHLARLRGLARQLSIDALHWTIAGRADKATDSVVASFALTRSLQNEPFVISGLVRIAIQGISQAAIETVMNRSMMPNAELVRLQRACDAAVEWSRTTKGFDHAILCEALVAINTPYTEYFVNSGVEATGPGHLVIDTAYQLAYPKAASNVAILDELQRALPRSAPPGSLTNDDTEDERFKQLAAVAPLVSTLWPSMDNVYEAEWRMRMSLQATATAIAVERFRLANGRLPESLQQLVPAYLAAVPEDAFARPGTPLGYRVFDNGKFVVYSVGLDKEDDRGVEMDRWWHEGDITFTVAPPSIRQRPQVSSTFGEAEPHGGGIND